MWSDIWNVSYIELRMWNQVSYDPRSNERNLSNCVYRSLKKFITARIIAYLILNEYGFLMIKFKKLYHKCFRNLFRISCILQPNCMKNNFIILLFQPMPYSIFFFQQCSMRQICTFHTYNMTVKLIVQVNTYILSVLLRSITEYLMSCAVF